MRSLLRLSLVSIFAIGAFSTPAQAQIPTIDLASIVEAARTVTELEKQFTALETQITQGTELFNLSDDIFSSLTGLSEDIANLANLDFHELPGSIQSLENRMSLLSTQYGIQDAAAVFGDAANVSDTNKASYDLHQDSILATLETSNVQLDVSSKTILRYTEFRNELRVTADMKESIDLNTRVAIENGLLLAQLLSAQAMSNQLASSEKLNQMNQEQYTEANADKWIFVDGN